MKPSPHAPIDQDESRSLSLSKQGYFFVGGRYIDTDNGRLMVDHMYVEYYVPKQCTRPFPLVMFAGGGQSGLNYTGTPDGRDGWMQHFVRLGYAVYVLDQPARARSPWQPEAGPLRRLPVAWVEQQFTAPARANLWPQAKLHTQWPGLGVEGDPVFDQFFAQTFPSLDSFQRQQELNRDAGAALLDSIGPAILLTHSQSGTFGWLVADARPDMVKAVVAIEPSGPPVRDNIPRGSPEWFEDGPLTKPYGLTAAALTYDPPVNTPTEMMFAREESAGDPNLARCWEQTKPARKLVNLEHIPILVLQAEASYHAPFDHCTVNFLRQAGVSKTSHIRLVELGIKGNGHMMMLERNNEEIALVIADWIERLTF